MTEFADPIDRSRIVIVGMTRLDLLCRPTEFARLPGKLAASHEHVCVGSGDRPFSSLFTQLRVLRSRLPHVLRVTLFAPSVSRSRGALSTTWTELDPTFHMEHCSTKTKKINRSLRLQLHPLRRRALRLLPEPASLQGDGRSHREGCTPQAHEWARSLEAR